MQRPPAAGAMFRIHARERLRRRDLIRRGVGVVYLATAVLYLTWRTTVFNPEAPLFSLIFYGAEVVGFILAAMIIALAWRYRVREPVAAPPGLKVDVFVPTYNESTEMVRRTVLAALRIRYPHETWLLDDGNRPQVRAIAEELGCRYIAREKNTNAKPGNLNNALKHATGDFVAVLDADYVGQENMLDRMLGYFSDAKVSFVQCPQDYYNVTAFQYRPESHQKYLWHDEAPFYEVLQPGRDFWNAASSCGTAVVYRRSAVDDVGGFAPETVTEDMHTALRLHMRGYSSVYHPESLAFGVAPSDFAEYQKTRHRWGQGNIQGLRCERMPFAPGLSLMQRLCYFQLGALYLEGWHRLVIYLTPPFVLMTGLYPVGNTTSFFWFFIPYILLDYICHEETLRGYGRVYLNEQLCMARFPIYIMSTFAVFFDYVRWRVSSKTIAGKLPIYLALPQVVILVLNVVAFCFGVYHIIYDPDPTVPIWITAFVCMFAAIYALVAALVVREATRCARYKRPDFRFDIPLPVRIDLGSGRSAFGVATSISTAGMTFGMGGDHALPLPASLSGLIYLPSGPLHFEGTPEPADQVARSQGAALRPGERAVLFQWADKAEKDRLDLTLHACGWHRRFVHPGEYLTTPIEWLEQKFSRRATVIAKERWTYVLYRRGRDPENELALGILETTEGRRTTQFAAFEKLSVGTHLVVFDPQAPAHGSQDVVVTRGAFPDQSEVELADAPVITYEIRAGRSPEAARLEEAGSDARQPVTLLA